MSNCPACHIGSLEKPVLTSTQWHDDQFIVVPDVVPEVCDYCGRREYDSTSINRLQQLLRVRASRPKRPPLRIAL